MFASEALAKWPDAKVVRRPRSAMAKPELVALASTHLDEMIRLLNLIRAAPLDRYRASYLRRVCDALHDAALALDTHTSAGPPPVLYEE